MWLETETESVFSFTVVSLITAHDEEADHKKCRISKNEDFVKVTEPP